MLEPGIRGEARQTVGPAQTARAVGSGNLPVLATPALLALMERAAMESVRPHLDEGQDTVGVRADIAHLAATPEGMEVCCQSELIAVDRRKLTFRLTAHDGAELICEGTHERVVVDAARFMRRAGAKAEAWARGR